MSTFGDIQNEKCVYYYGMYEVVSNWIFFGGKATNGLEVAQTPSSTGGGSPASEAAPSAHGRNEFKATRVMGMQIFDANVCETIDFWLIWIFVSVLWQNL